MNLVEVGVFVLYLAGLLGVGVWFFIKGKDDGEKGYFLGGRQMGPWVTALSAGASDMSAWVLMGLPTSVYALGLGQMWIAVGLALGYTLSWIYQAPRLRTFSIVANDSITIPEYLTNRFLSKSRALQIVCAIVFLVAYTIYSASSIKACGTLFNTVTGDVIVDIVETGKTLYENGLAPLQEIVQISARLIANKASFKFKGDRISALCAQMERTMNL